VAASDGKRFRLAFLTVLLLLLTAAGWYLRGLMRLGYIDSAIASVRTLVDEEKRFAGMHPDRGYACAISELDGRRLPERLGNTGYRNGYIFDLTCPATDPLAVRRSFQVTARPVQSGLPAYCSDQSGVLRTAEGGSTEECLKRGSPL